MEILAFRDPSGRVHILEEAPGLPPLAEGYAWTLVVRPDEYANDDMPPEHHPGDADHPGDASHQTPTAPGFLDVVMPLLTPRDDQSPQERAQELINSLPEDFRKKLAKLVQALAPPRPAQLPPFPGAPT